MPILICFKIELMKYFLIIATTFSLNSTNLTTLPTVHSDNENELEELLLGHHECASFWDITANPNITVSIETGATNFQKEQLIHSIQEINSLNLGFSYRLINSGGLIAINFVNNETSFFNGEKNVSLDGLQAFGYALKEGYVQPGSDSCYYIDKAEVFVDKDLDEIYTSLTVFHEMLHTTGLNHTSCISSMMYNKEGSPFTVNSFNNLPFDKVALEILYSSNNRLVNNTLIKKYLTTNNISVEDLCMEQKYDIVLFEDMNYVCDMELKQSPCYTTLEFTYNTSAPIDLWCDLNAGECDDYPFKYWDAVIFDEKIFYCNNESYCIEKSNFDPNNISTLTNFEIFCGEEFCEYISNTSNEDDLTVSTPSNSQEYTDFDIAGIIGFLFILLVFRKLYLDTVKKRQVSRVEIGEESSSYVQDIDGNFGEVEELFDENDFS